MMALKMTWVQASVLPASWNGWLAGWLLGLVCLQQGVLGKPRTQQCPCVLTLHPCLLPGCASCGAACCWARCAPRSPAPSSACPPCTPPSWLKQVGELPVSLRDSASTSAPLLPEVACRGLPLASPQCDVIPPSLSLPAPVLTGPLSEMLPPPLPCPPPPLHVKPCWRCTRGQKCTQPPISSSHGGQFSAQRCV